MDKSDEFSVDYGADCNVCQQIRPNLNYFDCDHVLCDDCHEKRLSVPLNLAPEFKRYVLDNPAIIINEDTCTHCTYSADEADLSFEIIIDPEENLKDIKRKPKEINGKSEIIEEKLKEIKGKLNGYEEKSEESKKKPEKIETPIETISEVHAPDASGFTNVSLFAFTQTTRALQISEPPKKRFNVVLFSETGCGKSKFINAFCNYLRFSTFDEAVAGDLEFLIPNTVIIRNQNLENKTFFCSAHDVKENLELSETRKSRHFDIVFGQYVLRIIKLKKLNEWIWEDAEIKEKIAAEVISSLGSYGDIHAACFLLKSNELSISATFSFYVDKLASSFTQNFCFIYVDSRESFLRPGTTLTVLESTLEDIKEKRTGPLGEAFKCDEENNFCLDSEALIAVVIRKNNISFNSDLELESIEHSWVKSVSESHRLKNYILKCQES